MQYRGKEVIKITKTHLDLYIMKYLEDGQVLSESFCDDFLYNSNIRSITCRGKSFKVSFIHNTNTHGEYSYMENANIKSIVAVHRKDWRAIGQLYNLQEMIKKGLSFDPKLLLEFLELMHFDSLLSIVKNSFFERHPAYLKTKFRKVLAPALIDIGYLVYDTERTDVTAFGERMLQEQKRCPIYVK